MERIFEGLLNLMRENSLNCRDVVIKLAFSDSTVAIVEFMSSECTKVMVYGTDIVKVNPHFSMYKAADGFFKNIPVDKFCEYITDAMPSYRAFRYTYAVV